MIRSTNRLFCLEEIKQARNVYEHLRDHESSLQVAQPSSQLTLPAAAGHNIRGTFFSHLAKGGTIRGTKVPIDPPYGYRRPRRS